VAEVVQVVGEDIRAHLAVVEEAEVEDHLEERLLDFIHL
jgi:hypothetical protein